MQIWVMALAFAAVAPVILPFTLLWRAPPAPPGGCDARGLERGTA